MQQQNTTPHGAQRRWIGGHGTVALAVAIGLGACTGTARAGDVEVAERFMKQVEEELAPEGKGAAQAELTLNTVIENLEGVEAARRAALEKRVAAAGQKIDAGLSAEKRERLMRYIRRDLDNMRENVASAEAVRDGAKQVEERLNAEDGVKLVTGVDRRVVLAEIESLRKASAAAVAKRETARVEQMLADLDAEVPKVLAAFKDPAQRSDSDVRFLVVKLDRVEASLKDFPRDDARTKELIARHAKLSGAVLGTVRADERERVVGRCRQDWQTASAPAAGWEQEVAAPSYKTFLSEPFSEKSVGLPKTYAAIQAGAWLQNPVTLDMLKTFGDDPEVVKMAAEAGAMKDAAARKFAAAIDALLVEARAAGAPDEAARAKWSVAEHDLLPMLYGTSVRDATIAKVKAMNDAWDAAAAAEARRKDELCAKLAAGADAAWAAATPKFAALGGIDPLATTKGQVVRLTRVRDRTGWEFSSRDYDLVFWVNGTPVAGRFDPAIKQAIAEAERQTGRSVGDTIDLVAVVEGRCRVDERYYSQILEDWRPKQTWDAPLLRVTAFHSGAVTVVANP
ncbi:MAG TPA: hypothetical protein VF796_26065 [Humisphaera sp.]